MTATSAGTAAIWREFSDGLQGYIHRRVSSLADAEDILQDVFLRIHANLSGLNNRERLAGWIYRVTANAITDFYRSRARAGDTAERLEREARVDAETRAPVAGDGDIERDRSLARYLESLVDTLPEKYREAMRLTELEGMTQKEAAAKVGISVSGMKSRVQRGRERLKDALLDCCNVELDRRRGIIDVRERSGEPCDCAGGEALALPG